MSLEGCYIIILVGHPRYGTSFNGDKYESHVKKSVKSFLSQKEKRKRKEHISTTNFDYIDSLLCLYVDYVTLFPLS